MIRLFSALILMMVIVVPAWSQDLKSLDYAGVYKKSGARTRVWKEIRFKGSAADTVLMGKSEFDASGRIVRFTEYFAGGRIFCEFEYSYDAAGKVSGVILRHSFNDMQPVTLVLSYDASKRVTAMEIPVEIRNYWKKATFSYNTAGVMIRCDQWYDQAGSLKNLNYRDYPASIQPKDNSLTYIHDQHNRLVLHQFYNSAGKVDRSWVYEFN